MKLRNRFREEDKIRVWVDHPYCVICGSNQNCSLHHIDGCKKSMHASIYNSVMLCHRHHKEADTHNTESPASQEYRQKLRDHTREHIEKQYYTNRPVDEEYNNYYTSNIS